MSVASDFWALGLAQHFLPGSTVANFFDTSAHGSDITWSSVLSLCDSIFS